MVLLSALVKEPTMKKTILVIALLLFSSVKSWAECMPFSIGAYAGRPFSLAVEGQVILPIDECSRSVTGPLLGYERGIGGSKLFLGYGENGDSSSGILSLHGGGSMRLAFWNVNNEAATVARGRYWGPEVQVAILLGLRLGVMIPTNNDNKTTLAASIGFAY